MNNNCGKLGPAVGAYDTKIAGLYDLLDTLGSGHFAVVKLARHVFTGEKVAVKVIDKSKLDEVSTAHLHQEVKCMKLVQHANVVKLYEVIDTQSKLYLILELGDGGDLYDYIMRHETGLSESDAREYFRQIVRAISYCHSLHVVHRDLKPENVVFFEKLGIVKLTDFGFSNKFHPGQKLETSCGSLAYSAPEILLGDSYDAPAVDIWSLGVILFMLVCGNPPFQEANDSETLTMIMDCKYTVPAHMSNACRSLIGRMLVREPEKRATLEDIAMDPWVTNSEVFTLDDTDKALVATEQLSEEERNAIIQKMVNGCIATKEQILEAVENDDYNNITATYYLLTERKLRARRAHTQRKEANNRAPRRPEALSVPQGGAQATSGKGTGRSLLAPPTITAAPRTPQDVPARSRKCSIVREEEDDDEESAVAESRPDSRRGSRSEGRLHLAARAHAPPPPAAASVQPPAASLQPPAAAGLHPASAPLIQRTHLADNLTRVNLEDEAVTEGGIVAGRAPPAPPPARRTRIECRRRRPRAGSCSSSDLSDDDSEKKKRAAERADVPPDTRTRRDSHDDSSDSQERGAGAGATGGARAATRPTVTGGSSSESAGAGGDGRAPPSAGAGGGRRRRAARKESRLRESRSLNRIAEVEEASGARWGGGGFVALCGRPIMRLLAAARPAPQARRLHGLC